MEEYDCISFEVDHCLVKYNVIDMTVLVVKSYLRDLHETFPDYYPEEVIEFDFHNNLGVFLNNAIWDIYNGTVLKIDEELTVTHAIHGFEKLSNEKIREIYGDPPKFKNLRWPRQVWVMEDVMGAHWTMMGMAKAIKVPVVCQVMDLIKKGVI